MYFGFRPAYPTYGMKVDSINNRNNLNLNPMNYNMNMNITNNSNKQRNRFSKEEDECLRMLVEEQEDNVDWNYVSSKMIGRTSRQCRERYRNYLRPNLVNGSWTDEEDQLLEKMYEKFGPQWSKIAQYFPKRSDVNIKNHHTCIVNRLSRQKKRKTSSSVQSNENTNNNLYSFNEHQNELETEPEIVNPAPITPSSMFAPAPPPENTLMSPMNRNPMVPEPFMPNPMVSGPIVTNQMIPNQMASNPMIPNPMMTNQMVPNAMMTNQMVSIQMNSTPIVSNPIISTPVPPNPIVSTPMQPDPIETIPPSDLTDPQPPASEPFSEPTSSNEQVSTNTLPTTEQPASDGSFESPDNQQIPFNMEENNELYNNLDFNFGDEIQFDVFSQSGEIF